LENGAADQFGDLGDDGVAEGGKSVHAAGKPINHSTHAGFGNPVLPSAQTSASSSL
jgi:hypothetical protein